MCPIIDSKIIVKFTSCRWLGTIFQFERHKMLSLFCSNALTVFCAWRMNTLNTTCPDAYVYCLHLSLLIWPCLDNFFVIFIAAFMMTYALFNSLDWIHIYSRLSLVSSLHSLVGWLVVFVCFSLVFFIMFPWLRWSVPVLMLRWWFGWFLVCFVCFVSLFSSFYFFLLIGLLASCVRLISCWVGSFVAEQLLSLVFSLNSLAAWL